MSRNVPSPPDWQAPPGGETITLHLKLITPMFGGGYEPREVDTVNPIRAASIRGHLRFWWRALYGGRHRNAAELLQAEEKLWGTMETPGQVGITILSAKVGEPVVWARFEKNPNNPQRYKSLATQLKKQWPRYALHPFQGQLAKGAAAILRPPDTAIESASFDLVISIRECQMDQVFGAVKAWVEYGGLGSRTRRGCGSLMLDSKVPLTHAAEPRAPGQPLLTVISGTRRVLGKPTNDPISAWNDAVTLYAAFRQMREPGRAPMPGRSKWPEPDSIRRIEGRRQYAHPPRHPVQRGFPRADLGLPIVFHFKDVGDPDEYTLQPTAKDAKRFASPVISKAVWLDGTFRPMIAVLNAPHAWEMGDLSLGDARVTREWIEMSQKDRDNCEPLRGKDARTALLEYACARWSSKVEVLP